MGERVITRITDARLYLIDNDGNHIELGAGFLTAPDLTIERTEGEPIRMSLTADVDSITFTMLDDEPEEPQDSEELDAFLKQFEKE